MGLGGGRMGGLMRFPSTITQFPELEVLSENCRSFEKP